VKRRVRSRADGAPTRHGRDGPVLGDAHRVEAPGRELEADGGLPVDDLPRRPSGRIRILWFSLRKNAAAHVASGLA
jgi:hypothetical protein